MVEQLARGLSAVPYLGTQLALGLLAAARPGGAEVAELLAGRPGCVVLDPTLSALAASGIAVDVGPDALAVGFDGQVLRAVALGDRLESVDSSRPLAKTVAAGSQLGNVLEGAITRWQARALALLCADLVGTCTGALAGAVAHACHRQQLAAVASRPVRRRLDGLVVAH